MNSYLNKVITEDLKKLFAFMKTNWLLILLIAVLMAVSFGAPPVVAWITVFCLFCGLLIKGMRQKRDD
jgi:fatty acid desaturase